jgi:hypothetical protein
MSDSDTPLTVEIIDDQLVIRIGIGRLAYCAEHCERFYDYEQHPNGPPYLKVNDVLEFAKEIKAALCSEREDGSGPLGDLLDDATEKAEDDGAVSFSRIITKPQKRKAKP